MRPILFLILLSNFLLAQDLSKLKYTELDSCLHLEYSNSNYEKAIEYSLAATKKAKSEFGNQSTEYAKYVIWNALLYQSMSEYQKSEPLYWESINIFAKVVGKESGDYVTGIMYLAYLYVNTGEYEKALPLYLEAQAIYEKLLGKDSPDYAASLNDLALLYEIIGKYELAEPLYLRAKNIYEKQLGKDNPNYSTCLNNLAKVYKVIGNYAQAEQFYIEAKTITAKTLGKEHQNYASNLNNLALFYVDMGSYAQAEPLLIEAKEIRKKLLGENHSDYGTSLNNLASMYSYSKKYKKAEPLFFDAMSILAKTIGKDHPDYANSLSNLANVYLQMGDYAKAEPLFLGAKDIFEKAFDKQHPKYISALNSLANLYKITGKLDKARAFLQEAISGAARKNMGLNVSKTWVDSLLKIEYYSNRIVDNLETSLGVLYEILAIEAALEQQILVSDLATQLLKKSRDGFANESDKLQLLSLSHDWMLRSLKVLNLNAQAEKAFEAAEWNKASLLLESSKTEQAYEMGDLPDSLAKKEKELFKKHSDLEANLLKNHPENEKDSLRSVLNSLTQEISTFKKEIEKKYPQYIALKYQQQDISVLDLQQNLPDEAAILEYVIGDSVVYIFYIDKQSIKIHAQFVDNEELNKRTKQLHDVLSNYALLGTNEKKSYQVFTEQAHWFYNNLIAPVLNNKKKIKQLIIVSDGELGHLPFETFLIEQAKQTVGDYGQLHYLVKDYKISYHYSAMLFLESKQKASKESNNPNASVRSAGQVFAMAANYNLKLDSSQNQFRLPLYQRMRAGLAPLPEAQKEIALLEENFQGFFGFDKMASEKIFKEKAGDYAIIHLAMHGLLDSKAPILSSLAFSEDGDSVENNFLQAYEISKMKLNASLVVLSACETGFGKFEKGNGIASLARAFVYAGVPSMIVSLWEVNDFATAELMKNLYKNLADGMDKDAALQEAKLQYIFKAQGIAAHPAFWSPFVLMGNTDAIYLNSKTKMLGWWIGGGLLLFAGIAVGFKFKKTRNNG